MEHVEFHEGSSVPKRIPHRYITTRICQSLYASMHRDNKFNYKIDVDKDTNDLVISKFNKA